MIAASTTYTSASTFQTSSQRVIEWLDTSIGSKMLNTMANGAGAACCSRGVEISFGDCTLLEPFQLDRNLKAAMWPGRASARDSLAHRGRPGRPGRRRAWHLVLLDGPVRGA